MQVNASVAESDIGHVEAGQLVTFRVDAYPDLTFTGKVSLVRLDPTVEQNVVSYITTIDVPNPQLRLRPGMTANVTIEIERASNVLRVPNGATRVRPSAEVFIALGQPVVAEPAVSGEWTLDEEGGRADAHGAPSATRRRVVWRLRSGRLEPIPVLLGTTDATHAAVLEGDLAEGVEVVTAIDAPAVPNTSGSSSPLLPSRRPPAGGRGGRGPSVP
jgi:HlyD family secretion protein